MTKDIYNKKRWQKFLSLPFFQKIDYVMLGLRTVFASVFLPIICKVYEIKLSWQKIDFDIDAVYLWVDGFEEQMLSKRNKYLQIENKPLVNQAIAKGRFFDNEELKYSLRSIQNHAPWIRNIFIVTDNQVPTWLKSHPKVKIVDHKDIIDEKYLPLFNASAIEFNIHKIQGLSEHFIFLNDDMMFARNTPKSFFFDKNGLPKKYMKMTKDLQKSQPTGQFGIFYKLCADVFFEKFKIYPNVKYSHSITPYQKQNFFKIIGMYKSDFERTMQSKFRQNTDILRYIVDFYEIYVEKSKVIDVEKYPNVFVIEYDIGNEYKDDIVKKNKPYMLCLNDTTSTKDEDRQNAKKLMETLYPNKSEFEL